MPIRYSAPTMGLAVAAKHPNALIAALAFLAVLISTWAGRKTRRKKGIGRQKEVYLALVFANCGGARILAAQPSLVVGAA